MLALTLGVPPAKKPPTERSHRNLPTAREDDPRSLEPQRVDRIKAGRFQGGVQPETDTDQRTKPDGDEDDLGADERGPAKLQRQPLSARHPQSDADKSSGEG